MTEPQRPPAGFPTTSLSRLRYSPQVRRLVQETHLSAGDLIYPLFVRSGSGVRQEIASMPGQFQMSLEHFAEEVRHVAELGLGGILLFGIPAEKDSAGQRRVPAMIGIIQQAVRVAKRRPPRCWTITDVCFCEYTDHGHCGVLHERGGRSTSTTTPRSICSAGRP
jgi:porphobilinogen synthase